MSYLTCMLYMLGTLATATVALVLARRLGVCFAIAAFAGVIATSNVIASKIVTFGPYLFVPAAVLMYASSFLITDVISEIWGKKEAFLAVAGGLIANVFLILGCSMAIAWKAAPFWGNQQAFASVLGAVPRVVVASVIAYAVSQTHDVLAFHFWKRKTGGKHLWLRNNLSTMVSQLLDTVIFITIAFYGILPLFPLILGQYIVKFLVAACDTPFCYLAVKLVKGGKND